MLLLTQTKKYMAFEKFVAFLSTVRVNKGEFHNFQSLKGGLYHVKAEHANKFIELYLDAASSFSETKFTSLVWSPPKNREYKPLCIDVDLELVKNELIPTSELVQLAYWFAEIVYVNTKKTLRELGVVINRRETNYKKTKDGVTFYKCGVHIFFFGINITTELARKIRNECLPFVDRLKGKYKNIRNESEDILDKKVFPIGGSGLILPGDRKPTQRQTAGYTICYKGAYSNLKEGLDGVYCKPEESIEYLRKLKKHFFGWIWGKNTWPNAGEPEVVRISRKMPAVSKNGTSNVFNLVAFCEATKGYTANYDEWMQIVFFCRSIGLKKKFVCDTLNKHWPNEDPQQNYRLWKDYKEQQVTIGSMKRYIFLHATAPNWDLIFPKKEYYNDYIQFVGKVVHREEVFAFLKRVVSYIFSVKQFTWRYTKTTKDRHGNTLTHEVLCLSKKPPWCDSDDFKVKLLPTRNEIIQALEGSIPEKVKPNTPAFHKVTQIQKLIASIEDGMSDKEAFTQANLLVGLRAEKKSMSWLLKRAHEDCKLTRYTDVRFEPYCGTEDTTAKNTLNTFGGFYLERYTPKKKVDIKKSYIWKYLRDCFCNGVEGELFDHILNMFAFKIQFPAERSESLHCLVSEKEGTGKSFCHRLWVLLLSNALVKFADHLEKYLERFNFNFNSALIIFIDDISAATQRTTRRLFSRCTCEYQKYEKKGDTDFELNEYSDIFITANNLTPLHINTTDRRQKLFHFSDMHHQDRKFFGPLSLELRDLDYGHAFYTFLKHKDLNNWHPSAKLPTDIKDKTIEACMVKSHYFLN